MLGWNLHAAPVLSTTSATLTGANDSGQLGAQLSLTCTSGNPFPCSTLPLQVSGRGPAHHRRVPLTDAIGAVTEMHRFCADFARSKRRATGRGGRRSAAARAMRSSAAVRRQRKPGRALRSRRRRGTGSLTWFARSSGRWSPLAPRDGRSGPARCADPRPSARAPGRDAAGGRSVSPALRHPRPLMPDRPRSR